MRKTFSVLVLVALCAAALAAVTPSAGSGAGSRPGLRDPFAGLPGRILGAAEASTIRGGDVVIKLNTSRTRLTVDVYSNDDELRRLSPKPVKSLEIDAHNRVVSTTSAPFIPSGSDRDALPVGAKLTSKPAAFPAGTWNITDVSQRSGNYGPNMISTDAVGRVEVYAGGVKVATAKDGGYAIHSNSKPFASSKSNGCIVVRQEDNATLADILRADKADATKKKPKGRSYQVINVGGD